MMKSASDKIIVFLAGAIALAVFLSVFVVYTHIFSGDESLLRHFFVNLFPRYIKDTFILSISVCAISIILGCTLAYLIVNFDFFGNRFFNIALMLPFAIPAYIFAFIYVGIMDYNGVFQTLFGFRIDFFNMGGAIFMLSISFYPYVYLFARASFQSEGKLIFDVGKILGLSKFKIFSRLAIFISRPAIVAGVLLVMMETLSDYGTAAYLGIDTFSAGIFKLWFDMNDLSSASVLSAILILVVFVLLIVENRNSRAKNYSVNSDTSTLRKKTPLKGIFGFLAFFYCFLVSVLGFIMPFLWLAYWALTSDRLFESEFYVMAFHSLKVSVIAALIITFVAFFLNYGARIAKSSWVKTIILKFSSIGYAMPGAAIGVSLMMVFMGIANLLDVQLLGTSMIVLVTGYLVRYLATAVLSLESGYSKLHKNLDDVSSVMNIGNLRLAFLVHIPLLKHFFTLSFIIVFVDTIKELPLSLILRPFDFETLSIRAFFYATDERVYDACLPAFFIVFISFLAILWIEIRRNNAK